MVPLFKMPEPIQLLLDRFQIFTQVPELSIPKNRSQSLEVGFTGLEEWPAMKSLHCSKIFWLYSSIILVCPFLERRKSIIPPLAQEILIHSGTLQHLETLHGTVDNSSISVSQCLGLCETFVATGDWRVPIHNQETPWLDSRKKIGYATLLFCLVFHQVHPMNMYFYKRGHVFVVQKVWNQLYDFMYSF